MPAEVKGADGGKTDAPLRVVFLVDITGSMGNQLEGVKQMLREYCRSARGVKVSIMTYTEDSKQGYTTYFTAEDPSELAAYVTGIKLCEPPDRRGVNASGGDGPENVLQGLAATSAVSLDERLLLFIVTDAPPHDASQRNNEAVNERRALVELGLAEDAGDVDMYRVLDRVLDARRGRVAICPLMYGVSGRALHFYAQCAALTGGLLLKSTGSGGAAALARTLQAIVDCVAGGAAARALEGFEVLGLTGFEEAEDESAPRAPPTRLCDTHEALLGLQKTVQTLAGRKWSRRAKACNLEGAVAALKLALSLGASKVPCPDLFTAALEHIDGPDQPFLKDAAVAAFRAAHAARLEPRPEQECLVSLESAQEAIAEAAGEGFGEDPDALMHVFLKLLLARLVDVKFPNDKDGNPDFMDPWSADIRNVGASTISAFAAMKFRDAATGMYKDPQTREEMSGVLVLAEPGDAFGSAVLQLASATPLLDLVTHYLLSGTVKLYRNIWAGSAASVLYRVMCDAAYDGALSERGWALARSVLHSLHVQGRPVAASVVKQMEQGHANPADAMSKLFAALLQVKASAKEPGSPLFTVFAQELVTGLLMQHKRLHPDEPSGLAPEALLKVPELAATAQHPLEQGLQVTLDAGWKERCAQAFSKHPTWKRSRQQLAYSFALLHADAAAAAAPEVAPAPAALHGNVFMESWFLGKRSARYTSTVAGGEVTHTPLPPSGPGFLKDLAVEWLRQTCAKEVTAQCRRRAAAAKAQLLERAMGLTGEADPNAALLACTLELAGTTYRLGRGDAKALLARGPPQWKRAVVLGSWTTESPSYLSRDFDEIVAHFEGKDKEEVADALRAKAVCKRAKANRQGHTAANPGPGAHRWSEGYAAARLAEKDRDKIKTYLGAMKAYTGWVDALGDSAKDRVLKKVALHLDDANRLKQLEAAKATVEAKAPAEVDRLEAFRGKFSLALLNKGAAYEPADRAKKPRLAPPARPKRT